MLDIKITECGTGGSDDFKSKAKRKQELSDEPDKLVYEKMPPEAPRY